MTYLKSTIIIVICFLSTGFTQIFPYVASTGNCGVGYRVGKTSPYLGLEFSSNFNRDYDRNVDTLIFKSSYINFSPNVGLFVTLVESKIDVFIDAQIGTTIRNHINYLNYLNLFTLLGVGLEKKIENGIGISGEISVGYSFRRIINTYDPNVHFYNDIYLIPFFSLKYYIPEKTKESL